MRNIVRKFAVAAMALSVSAGALAPLAANAATEGSHATNQTQYNVPNNVSGPHGGRKAYEIWKAKQDQKAQPDAAVIDSKYQQTAVDVLQNLRGARLALTQNKLTSAKALLGKARSDLANMYNAGVAGNFNVAGPTLVSQDYVTTFTESTAGDKVAVVTPVLTNISSTNISIPFAQTKQKLDLAYNQLINNERHQAKMTLADAESGIIVNSDFIVAAPQAS